MAAVDNHDTRWRLWVGGGTLCGQGEPSGYVGGWEATAQIMGAVPDLDDNGTRGCLLVQAWGMARDSIDRIQPLRAAGDETASQRHQRVVDLYREVLEHCGRLGDRTAMRRAAECLVEFFEAVVAARGGS